MNETKITDKFLKNIEHLQSLQDIWLEGVRTTDEGISSLVILQNLSSIYLASSAITDAGLESLAGLPKLTYVSAQYCPNVSRRAIAALRKKLPAVSVKLNYSD